MRRLALLTSIALALAAAPGALAAQPLRDTFDVDATFPDDDLTAACGTPVTITFLGTFSVKVFYDTTGAIVREIDTQPSTKLIFESATGSYSLPFSSVLHTDYGDGAHIGDVVTGEFTGRDGGGSGRLVMRGTVIDIEDGVPLVRFTDPVSASGNFTGEETICAALAP